jgi:hypothetical protein
MKLKFNLNGSPVDCAIGLSVLTAAFEKIKQSRHDLFRATMSVIASSGSPDAKDSLIMLLEDHIRNQVPTDQEVRDWLLTCEGQAFCLVHGTRNYPTKLTPETANMVLDEMSEEESRSLADGIAAICYGTEKAQLNRQWLENETEKQRLRLGAQVVEIDALKAELERLAKREDAEPTTSAQDAGK